MAWTEYRPGRFLFKYLTSLSLNVFTAERSGREGAEIGIIETADIYCDLTQGDTLGK